MADYKLVDSNKLDADLASVANAIRKRAGTSAKMEFPSGFENTVANIPWGGEELPKLTNPGYATDLALDKQLIDQNGNRVTGTLHEVVADKVAGASGEPFVRYNAGGSIYIAAKTAETDIIVRAGAYLRATAPGSLFGNATADDVVAGRTFTSEKGVMVTGTHVCESEGGIDTSDATATEDQILKNRTAYAKGEKLTGTIESLATTTITPGTTAQTITRKYIDGTLTIKGDSKLKPENIKEGVKIFDVLGTLAASSGGTVEIGEGIEVESLSEAHYWTKTGKTGGSINETYDDRGTTIGLTNTAVQYADEVTLEGNNLVLVNPKSYTLTMDDDAAAEVLVGKYFSDASGFYRIPSDAGIIYYAPTQYTKGHLNATKVYKLSVTPGTEEQFSIIVSGDRNAYPDNGEKDGFTYVYQGVVTESDLPEVEQATPTISVDANGLITASATQEAGQVAAGTKSATKQLTTQAAQTITPGTSNKTIASGKYLTGTQTIKGDSNLKAENIKKGVSIFGVDGSHECEEGVTLPKLSNPGTASDVAIGKELIDQNGKKVTGTLKGGGGLRLTGGTAYDYIGDGTGVLLEASMDVDRIFRAGDNVGVVATYDKFGNATAADVAKGKTFTSAAGLLVNGEHECEGGVELPELGDTAAQPTDMVAGKVLYDDKGNPVTGTLFEANEIREKIWATSDYSFGGTAGGTTFNVSGMYNGSSGVPGGLVVRTGAGLGIRNAPTNFFGDAMPGDVAKGKKFTSAAGLLVEGTHECEGGVELPELGDTAAQPTDMVAGKVLYDDKGNPVTGTLHEVVEGKVAGASTDPIVRYNSDGSIYIMSKTATIDALVRAGAYLRATAPGSLFGDATADDVVKGKFFTSAAGVMVEGTMEAASGPQLPDGAIVVQIVKGEQASTQIGSGYSLSISYADAVEINDSIALAFVGTAKTLSNISATTDFSVLLGKYIRSSGSYGSTGGTFYYIPDDATFTVGGQSMSKTLTCDKAQLVSLQKVII